MGRNVRLKPQLAAIPSGLVGVTSSRPAAVRANRSGRYMSSTVAAGCTNEPGVTARTM